MERSPSPAGRPRLLRFLRLDDDLGVRALRLAGALAAFFAAYRGVQLLYHNAHITRGEVYFIASALILGIATWGLAPSAAPVAPAQDGAAAGERAPSRWRALARAAAPDLPAAIWWLLLLCALGLAFAFRLYLIAEKPAGVWFDEAQNGLLARRILDGYRPIFIGDLTQLPALFFYVFAGSVKVLGQSVTALRAVTTAAGILNVVLVYFLGRELFGHRAAVLATFFLGIMRWHVNFSRFAMHGIFAPLFTVAALLFLARGLNNKGWWNFPLAGIMVGIGLQGYFSYLLTPFIIAAFVLHHTVFARKLTYRRLALNLGLFGLAAAIVYSPVAVWAYRNQDQFNQRATTVTVTKDRSFTEIVDVVYKTSKQHLLMFHAAGDRNGRHNVPGEPMLDTYTGFLMVLGAGYCFWRFRDPGHFLLLAWVVIALQSGVWSLEFEAPQAYRTVAVTPAVAMLAALPLALLWQIALPPGESGPQRRSRFARAGYFGLGGIAAAATVFMMAQAGRENYDSYFNEQLDRPDVWPGYSTDVTFIAREMRRLGTGPEYYLASNFLGQPTLEFENPYWTTSTFHQFDWVTSLPGVSDDRDVVYFLDNTKTHIQAYLQDRYPTGEFFTLTPPNSDVPIVYEAIIPAEAVQAFRGVDATYTSGADPPVTVREPALNFDWSVEAPPALLPLQARWTTFLEIPEYRTYRLRFEVPGNIRLFLDGELAVEGADRVETLRLLYRGEHEVTIEADVDRPGLVLLSWNTPPEQQPEEQQAIPATAYFFYEGAGGGLLASYYEDPNFEGQPVLQQLEPMIGNRYHAEVRINIPFTILWEGFLDVPADGQYTLTADGFEQAWVGLDGESPPTDRTGVAVPFVKDYILTAGRHPIEVRFWNFPGSPYVYLRWRQAEQPDTVIPYDYLRPR